MSGPNRNYKSTFAAGTGYVSMDGYVTISDSVGTVGAQFIDGCQSVTRTNTGEYTFVLENSFPEFKGIFITFCSSLSNPDYTYQVNSFSAPVGTAGLKPVQTIVVTFKTGASPTNLPANTGMLVNIKCKKTDLGKGR